MDRASDDDVAKRRDGAGRPREEGGSSYNLHVMTPETETTTHYFYWDLRPVLLRSDEAVVRVRCALDDMIRREETQATSAMAAASAGNQLAGT